jgi:hypothetical protein
VVTVSGVRDRLRVLLVSGEPHAGERVWRNLLKADPSVDLIHFTILRPPDKQDSTPLNELSLIAFPYRELFLEKLDSFDLVVFDRYRERGILPLAYFQNIASYVQNGGALLISSGPEFADGSGGDRRFPSAGDAGRHGPSGDARAAGPQPGRQCRDLGPLVPRDRVEPRGGPDGDGQRIGPAAAGAGSGGQGARGRIDERPDLAVGARL